MACDVVTTSAPLNLNVIGPRSVIVPADPIIWDEGTSYEYLTLVASTDFGQGYVAKKDVPSGTPLTNTDYWIPVASFNAQLSSIQTQLANKADTSTVTALQQSLNEEVTRATGAEKQLQTGIDNLNKKPILVIYGDSWSTGNFGNWFDTVSNALGAEVKNYAVDGAGFTTTSTIGAQVNNSMSMSADEKARTKFVVVEGGLNDMIAGHAVSDVTPIISTVCQQCQTMFPNALILYCPNICSVNEAATQRECFNLANAAKINIGYGGYTMTDTLPYFWPGHSDGTIFRDDNHHLTDNAMKMFAENVLYGLGHGNAPLFYVSSEMVGDDHVTYRAIISPNSIVLHGIISSGYTTGKSASFAPTPSLQTPLNIFGQQYYMTNQTIMGNATGNAAGWINYINGKIQYFINSTAAGVLSF